MAAPTHPAAHRGHRHRPGGKPGPLKEADDPAELPHLPPLPGWTGGKSSRAVADNTSPPASPAEPRDNLGPVPAAPSSSTHRPAQAPSTPAVAQNVPPTVATKAHPHDPQPVSRAPEPGSVAPEGAGEHGSQGSEPSEPLCGTYCKLTLGAAATGPAVVGGELAKDGIIIGAAAAGGETGMSAAGVAGGAVAGTIVMDGVAEHLKPSSAPTGPTQPPAPEPQANSADLVDDASSETAGETSARLLTDRARPAAPTATAEVQHNGPYNHLPAPKRIEPGKDVTRMQKREIRKANAEKNGGVYRDDDTGELLSTPQQSRKGVTPAPNEAQIDHVKPKAAGGTNDYSNLRVISRERNIAKGSKVQP